MTTAEEESTASTADSPAGNRTAGGAPEPATVLAREDDPPEPPEIALAREDDPPEPPEIALAREDDPPEPAGGEVVDRVGCLAVEGAVDPGATPFACADPLAVMRPPGLRPV